jgi:hypothetical protein
LFGFVVREVATLHERIVAPKHVGRNIVNPICSSPGQERWWRQFAAGVRNIDAPDDCSLPQSVPPALYHLLYFQHAPAVPVSARLSCVEKELSKSRCFESTPQAQHEIYIELSGNRATSRTYFSSRAGTK